MPRSTDRFHTHSKSRSRSRSRDNKDQKEERYRHYPRSKRSPSPRRPIKIDVELHTVEFCARMIRVPDRSSTQQMDDLVDMLNKHPIDVTLPATQPQLHNILYRFSRLLRTESPDTCLPSTSQMTRVLTGLVDGGCFKETKHVDLLWSRVVENCGYDAMWFVFTFPAFKTVRLDTNEALSSLLVPRHVAIGAVMGNELTFIAPNTDQFRYNLVSKLIDRSTDEALNRCTGYHANTHTHTRTVYIRTRRMH